MWFRRLLVVGVCLLLITAWLSAHQGQAVQSTCGPVVTTPLQTRAYRKATSVGEGLRRFTDGDVSAMDVVTSLLEMFHTIGVWRDALNRGLHGDEASKEGKAYERATREAQSRAAAACCPAAPVDPTPPDTDPVTPPDATRPPDPRAYVAVNQTRRPDEAAQLALVAVSNRVGASMGMTQRDQVVSVGVMLVESEIQNLSFGDRDSVGPWQQRASWGTVSQRMQPSYGAKAFYKALLKVPNRDSRPMGEVAQAVQRSAFPARYQGRMGEAQQWWDRAGGTPTDELDRVPDPDDPSTPAYCNPSSAERNSDLVPVPGLGGSLAAFTTATAQAQIRNPRTPAQALAWLARQHQDTSTSCLHYVAAAYGYNSTQPVSNPRDGGQWGADEQWYLIPARYRHPGDEAAPPGAVMWWDGGNPDGHVALSLGGGMVRSTGVAAGGGVGDKPLAYFDSYGEYLGWTLPYWAGRSTIGVAA